MPGPPNPPYELARRCGRPGRVSKTYRVDGRALQVLEDIDLTIAPGEFVTIVGASGCGKSTLLRIIATARRGSPFRRSGHGRRGCRPGNMVSDFARSAVRAAVMQFPPSCFNLFLQ
jgi:ABC-type lipoprotein export system ATPase subunit